MKFYVSSAFLDLGDIVEIAKAADDLGYEGMAIPDHVVNLETLMVLAYNRKLGDTPFLENRRLSPRTAPEIPFQADRETIERIRGKYMDASQVFRW